MEKETSWECHYSENISREIVDFESFSEVIEQTNTEEANKGPVVSIDAILPDDLIERILAYLPVASIIRTGSVCKRWNEIVNSRRFLCDFSSDISQKPWYFMFISSDDPGGYAYDPMSRKWYSFELPCIKASNWLIASSCGLVCSMDSCSRSKLYVSNPITKRWKRLEDPPGLRLTDYSALAISVNRKSRGYTIALAKSKQEPDDFRSWELSIHIYDSEIKSWVTSIREVLTGWRGGEESIICGGVLYCLIYAAGVVGGTEKRHGLIMYDLSTRSSHVSLMQTCISVPCSLTCGRLMNLRDSLVMVGGIGKPDRPDIIKGIGIWVLQKEEWREVSRMPHKFFQGFGELDDVFASSGTDDLIFIQSYGAPALLVFDMSQKQWKWSPKSPVTKKFPLQLFTGFSFEPRLDVSP